MLDKDFDAFFKSSLKDYEITPTAASWTKVSDEIAAKSARKKYPLFWMAAASTIIVLGFGIGLYNKPTDVVKLQPNGKKEITENLALEQKSSVSSNLFTDEPADNNSKKPVVKSQVVNRSKARNMTTGEIAVQESISVEEPVTVELATVKNTKSLRPKLATEQLLAQEEIMNMRKTEAVILEENQDTFIANALVGKTTLGKRVKIASVGDLVNFVVAKVDKRDDKIIKMSKTEESDNEITGINLGLFKFNKLD